MILVPDVLGINLQFLTVLGDALPTDLGFGHDLF
jgi:hypothetical protein